jgi:hypothetical protein
MRLFNKAVVIIGILLALPLCTLALVAPAQTLAVLAALASGLAARVANLAEAARLILGLSAIALDLVLVWLLVAQFRRPPAKSARVSELKGGEAGVSLDAISQRVAHAVRQVPDVIEVQPDVQARGGRVRVRLEVVTSPYVQVPERVAQIVEVVKGVVEGEMGLKLKGKPDINVQHASYQAVPPPREVPPKEAAPAQPPRPGPSVPAPPVTETPPTKLDADDKSTDQ